ncbi:hypothetical protein H261_11929 [Paramagnetospirillum caucaseum]|uniref:Uncharacterized protein n=1 Tax=Paramagnetospirillum caucaseum TaxID=1244869 RepID=M2ZQZ5_9PROT|nr:hypothetical protein [Paramagnetospirillum caucaseum]EME69742.1 hypothetical protein H261_11929 [Paramagnetospirillum caucaseum]
MQTRTEATLTYGWEDAGTFEMRWGNETLLIPAPVAKAMAQDILGQPISDIAKAALAVANAP